MSVAVSKLYRSIPMRMAQLRGEKGSASPPLRGWKEMDGDKSEFKNAQYPVDTADIHIYIYIYMYGIFSSVRSKGNK